MKKITGLLIAVSLALAGAAFAQQTAEESPAAGGKKQGKEQTTQQAEPKAPKGARGERAAKPEAGANAQTGAAATTETGQGKGKRGRGAKAETSAAGAAGTETGAGATTETGAGKGKRGRAKTETSAATGATGTGAAAGAGTSASAPMETGKKGKKGRGANAAASASPATSAAPSMSPATARTSPIASPGAAGAAGATGSTGMAGAAGATGGTGTSTAATSTTGGNLQGQGMVGRGGKRVEQQQIQQIKQQHASFKAQPKPNVAPAVTFNQNYRIQNSQTWVGPQYEVFRSYHPEWHDQGWYHSHYGQVVLIAGGWYFLNQGYWYPAWGYDQRAAYYAYDGPIYVGHSSRPPDQVIADTQATLQAMGYYTGEVDGLLGPLTRQALRDYQADHGLMVTETIDQPTLDALQLS